MPNTTPIFGIRYPCADDVITQQVFQDFANDVDTVLSLGDTSVNSALNRPTARVATNADQGGIAVNTATNLVFQIEQDNDGMANLGVNNERLTVQTAGIYLVEANIGFISGFTTITSRTITITQNGTAIYRVKTHQGNGFTSIQGVLQCAVNDIIRAQILWTGTGGPATIQRARLALSLITLTP